MSRDGGSDARTTRRGLLAAGAALAAGGAIAGGGTAGTVDAGSRTRRVTQTSGDWPSFKNGPRNAGYAAGRSAPVGAVSPAWTFDVGSPIRTTPAVAGGTVYVGADDGRLYALDAATGDLAWRYGTTSTVRSSPAVGDGTVAFGVQDAAFHALDASDGSRRWVATFGDTERASAPPTIADGTVYLSTVEGGSLYAYDARGGEELWTVSVDSNSAPAVAGGAVHVVTERDGLVAYSRADGTERWGSGVLVADDIAPAVADGTLYLPWSDRVFMADAGTEGGDGASIGVGRFPVTSVTVAADTLFAVDGEGRVVAIDPAAGVRDRILWEFDTGSTAARSPVVAGATLFVGCEDGSVHAVDASTGEGRWRFETGGAVRGPPAVVDGTVYVGSADGTLYALTGETRTETLSTVEGTPTPTPTRSPTATASPTPSPTPTRSPTPESTGMPSPTAEPTGTSTPIRTPTRTARPTTRTPTVEPTRSPPLEASSTVGSGRNALVGDVPTDLLFGVGGLAALGGTGLAVRRLLSDDDGGTDSGDGSADDPPAGGSGGGAPGETPATGASAGAGTDPDDPFAAAAERTGEPDGTAADADGATRADDPETLDIEEVRGSPGLSAGEAVAYDDIERVAERPTADGTVAHEALLPTPAGERRVLLRQPAAGETLDADVMARFADAAETWAALGDHENVVEVVEWGTEPLPWLALAHLDRDLTSIAGKLSPAAAATVAAGIAEGVHHGHTRGVTHRALRPGAVRLAAGDPPRPAVGDWGLADAADNGTARAVSLAPAYAAPEQFDAVEGGEGTARRTDVYGLGAVCYELFTGQPPFEGDQASVLAAKGSGTAPRPTAVDDGLPDAVDTVLGTAMAVDPADRYEDVLYLRDALRDLAR